MHFSTQNGIKQHPQTRPARESPQKDIQVMRPLLNSTFVGPVLAQFSQCTRQDSVLSKGIGVTGLWCDSISAVVACIFVAFGCVTFDATSFAQSKGAVTQFDFRHQSDGRLSETPNCKQALLWSF